MKVRKEQCDLAEHLWKTYQQELKLLVLAHARLCEANMALEKLPEAGKEVDIARKCLESVTEDPEQLKAYVDIEEGLYLLP